MPWGYVPVLPPPDEFDGEKFIEYAGVTGPPAFPELALRVLTSIGDARIRP